MYAIVQETLRTLLADHEAPCLSLYQPTHRHHPDNQQDPIRFKNLCKTIEESLLKKYNGRQIQPVLERFKALGDDSLFWKHTLDGLAVFASTDTFLVLPIQRSVPELAIVSDSFHVKPLLRYQQSADRFQVLALTRHTAKLYEGNRYALDPLDLGDYPATIKAALGEELTEPHRVLHTSGGATMQHGHGSKKDEVDKDAERFFRVIDRETQSRFSKPSGLPLILVALTEHQPVFREVSQNPALLAKGVEINPEALDLEAMRQAVWSVVEPRYLERLAQLSEAFTTAQAHHRGSADLSDVSRAAVEGRVGTLLIESERVIPGKIDPKSGAMEKSKLQSPDVDDLLDDLAEAVMRTGGEVVVVPKERMPTSSGLAATYRY